LQIWFRHHDNFENAVTEAVGGGGDTDTVAAIIGGIVGAKVGKRGLPENWLNRLAYWPTKFRGY
jgi:ADP-ribosylglycohydrolase